MKNKNLLIYFIIIIIFSFTIFIIKYIHDTKNDYRAISEKILFEQASTLFNNIVTIRKWNSDHGSVYVKKHDNIEPNPYLFDNHLYSKDDELLVKVNPAWMTRQLSELSNKNEDYYFKITSLNPINPNNAPDEFEKEGLEILDKNKNLDFFTQLEEDKYSLIGPLMVEPSCLQCHGEENYNVGDVRGGLRVSVPIDYYNENIRIVESKTNILYFITFFTSAIFIAVIIFAIYSINLRELNITKLNKTLERKVSRRTKELKDANKKLLELSTTDYLTNIPNRRFLFETGFKYFHLAKREKTNLSIVCIDIDYFKNINDTYGHDTGDEILKLVANSILPHIRKSDIFARTGGEEFTILLNKTNETDAFIFAEKIRTTVENLTYKKDEAIIKTTISLGISQLRQEDKDLNSIINRADNALYKAKKESRNISIIYS